MALLLSTFCVPEPFENYLTVFLMEEAEARGQKFISVMHKTQYGNGENQAPPPLKQANEVEGFCKDFFQKSMRSRFSVDDTGAMVEYAMPSDGSEGKSDLSKSSPVISGGGAARAAIQNGTHATVLYDFEGDVSGGELTVKVDEQVEVLDQSSQDW